MLRQKTSMENTKMLNYTIKCKKLLIKRSFIQEFTLALQSVQFCASNDASYVNLQVITEYLQLHASRHAANDNKETNEYQMMAALSLLTIMNLIDKKMTINIQ